MLNALLRMRGEYRADNVPSEAEDYLHWVRFWIWAQESIGIEDHGVNVDRFIMRHFPVHHKPFVSQMWVGANSTYHILVRIIEPAGMKYPSCTSSSVDRWGPPALSATS